MTGQQKLRCRVHSVAASGRLHPADLVGVLGRLSAAGVMLGMGLMLAAAMSHTGLAAVEVDRPLPLPTADNYVTVDIDNYSGSEMLADAATNDDDRAVLASLTAEHPRDHSMNRALAWLRQQQRPDGRVQEELQHSGAMTALAVMAHLAAGLTFQHPDHGAWLQRSLGYVLQMQSANGYFGETDNSRMYGHGLCTLMLAEALGMIGDDDLERRVQQALERALRVTEQAARVRKRGKNQRFDGGWRYDPSATDADVSLSGWQLMSLHASREVGIPVDPQVIAAACAYTERMTTSQGEVGYYKAGQDRASLRGVSLLAFAIAGQQQHPKVDAVAAQLADDPIQWRGAWLFYRMYYDAVGLSRARPEQWATYQPQIERIIINNQHPEGWWPSYPGDNESRFGRAYGVCMAVLALSVDRYALPAYQH